MIPAMIKMMRTINKRLMVIIISVRYSRWGKGSHVTRKELEIGLTGYKEAPPLLASGGPSLVNRSSKLLLRLVDIHVDLLSTLVNVLDHFLLLRHQLFHLAEERRKLNNGLLDPLNLGVTRLDLTKSRPSLTTTVSRKELLCGISTHPAAESQDINLQPVRISAGPVSPRTPL